MPSTPYPLARCCRLLPFLVGSEDLLAVFTTTDLLRPQYCRGVNCFWNAISRAIDYPLRHFSASTWALMGCLKLVKTPTWMT